MKSVCRALLVADVQLEIVQSFKKQVTAQINSQLRQHSQPPSTGSATNASKKKGGSAASTAFDAASGTCTNVGATSKDAMEEVYIKAAAAGVNTRRVIQKVGLPTPVDGFAFVRLKFPRRIHIA